MNNPGKVAIIGGGLAGSALAHQCIQNGAYPIVYERENALACAASGNDVGLVSPRISAEMDRSAHYFSIGFLLHAFNNMLCSLHAFTANDARKNKTRESA